MMLATLLGGLALLSLGLTLWQWLEARRFPLHRRRPPPPTAPGVTLLKPLKGADPNTAACLRSWFAQEYPGPVQLLFAVASAEDPVCPVVRAVLAEFPARDAALHVGPGPAGPNAKVAKLAQLQGLARHDLLVVSDADVWAPPEFLVNLIMPLTEAGVGLVNPFYCLANPATLAMRWEAVAINADFWGSVLQANRLGPMRFALGAVMAVRRADLEAGGGFAALQDYLADDFELGRRVAKAGGAIRLCPVVVECREPPQGWRAVWRHQLRWARTIRVCMPWPYAWSILSNATLWPLAWWAACPGVATATAFVACLAVRLCTAADQQRRLARRGWGVAWLWLVPLKDLLQVGLWLGAFLGNRVEWRGQRYTVGRDGRLVRHA